MKKTGKGNRHKRTLSDLINTIYSTKDNDDLNAQLLSKFMKKEHFSIDETKEIYDKFIVYIFKESEKYGTLNILNFGSVITVEDEKKSIKIRFNQNIKNRLKLLNENNSNNKECIILCDTQAKIITYMNKIDLSIYLIKDFNALLEKYMEKDKLYSKSGKIWKYIMLEFYTQFFLKTFNYIENLLFTYYMIDVDKVGTFCFKSNKTFGLYIKYKYKEKQNESY